MPNLKSLKVRINSVKSTQKITRAMKMVSASKLRRARETAEAAAPYAEKMSNMVMSLAASLQPDAAPPLLVGNGRRDKYLLVVVSSDRGLCGGLNSTLIKHVKRTISELTVEGKDVSLFCIGKKAKELLGHYQQMMLHKVEGITKKKRIDFEDARTQAVRIIELFDSGTFDVCQLFYNKFESAISQKVTKQQIIPLQVENHAEEGQPSKSLAQYEYEPNEALILNALLPQNIMVQLYHAFLENAASEHGARMTAMDNATRNAGEMIKRLTLVYNRTRQATITKELIEIISGAEAL